MRTALRLLARLALGPLLLAACAAAEPPPETGAGPVPVALRLTLAGATDPVLGEDGTGRLELAREGADAPAAFPFENGALAVHALPPGRYEVTRLGPLLCRGLAFEVGPAPRYLGSVGVELVQARHQVALMSRPATSEADLPFRSYSLITVA